ncbi:sensor histidine kinase [Aurantiacibacter odishensis]|uniref:sensor histidine kinase n=1 Tax=Aurantiacibacter odishensis TaxID=1155476 RepID=UPI000E712BCE|nr:histidine kinase dimerization/phospho-acceptor domain-containing protein [Aurantiacibacter odishensis]
MFDDRLATVLRMRVGSSEAGLRTQFRQLLDLLGTREMPMSGKAMARLARSANALSPLDLNRILVRPALEKADRRFATIAGFVRLNHLQTTIPQEDQSAILREPGLRLRNPEFVAFLAEGDPKPAAAAVATARLTEDEWLDLIPRLPMTARGFLRHRRDLTPAVERLLESLGVQDLVLPTGQIAGEEEEEEPPPPSTAPAAAEPGTDTKSLAPPPPLEGIGELRRRITAFQEGRRQGRASPRLPLDDRSTQDDPFNRGVIDLVTDASGTVVRADGAAGPMLAGLKLAAPVPGDLVNFDEKTSRSLRRRLPLHGALVTISAAPEVSGEWRMHGAPLFARQTGDFEGYSLRLYRRNRPPMEEHMDTPGDAMRQVLHELRTPVNAIQGFAEIIQQQIFGPAPHEYRAHAASIAGDAATLLAGFDEVDRLVKLDSGAMRLDEGATDLREALADTVERLDRVLRARSAGFSLMVSGSPFQVALERSEAMALCWRLLATAAGALGPGEEAQLDLSGDGKSVCLRLDIPQGLRGDAPDISRDGQRRRAISAGMFGPRFTFRLAEVEARAAGGSLDCEEDRVTLQLPSLTSPGTAHSSSENGTGG